MKPQRQRVASTTAIAGLVILAAMAGMVGYYVFVVNAPKSGVNAGSGVNPNPNTPASQSACSSTGSNFIPNVGVALQPYNTLTSATLSPTNNVQYIFHYQGSRLSALQSLYGTSGVSLTTTTATYALNTADCQGGYVLVSMYGGDTSYPDIVKIAATGNNPSIVYMKWITVTNVGRPDLVAEISLAALGQPQSGVTNNLQVTFSEQEFVQSAAPTLTDSYTNHDIKSIGVSANTLTNAKWTLNGMTANTASAIAKIAVFNNDSSSSPYVSYGNLVFGDTGPSDVLPSTCSSGSCTVSYSGVPFTPAAAGSVNGGQLTLNFAAAQSLGYVSATQTFTYQYWPGQGQGNYNYLANAIIIANPSNSFGDTTFSLAITTSYTCTAIVCATAASATGHTLQVTWISGAGALQTALTDKVTTEG